MKAISSDESSPPAPQPEAEARSDVPPPAEPAVTVTVPAPVVGPPVGGALFAPVLSATASIATATFVEDVAANGPAGGVEGLPGVTVAAAPLPGVEPAGRVGVAGAAAPASPAGDATGDGRSGDDAAGRGEAASDDGLASYLSGIDGDPVRTAGAGGGTDAAASPDAGDAPFPYTPQVRDESATSPPDLEADPPGPESADPLDDALDWELPAEGPAEEQAIMAAASQAESPGPPEPVAATPVAADGAAAPATPTAPSTPPRARPAARALDTAPTPPPARWGVLANALALSEKPHSDELHAAPLPPGPRAGRSWLKWVVAALVLAAVAGAAYLLLATDAYQALREHF